MLIEIDDKYAIKGDRRQYMLCEKVKPTKKQADGWKPFQYYHSLENLIQNFAEMRLRESDAEGVAEVLAENKRILRTLAGALSPHFDVEIRER